jgi:maleylpyruvate isomerase
MSRTEAQVREWLDTGTRMFLNAVDGLGDGDFDAETELPGWTRRHVIAHLHFNAEACRRLVSWARTGERNPMYAGPEHRNAEIEKGAGFSPGELRELVRSSAKELSAEFDALPDSAWRAEIVTAQGRTVPATEIPWMRTREVAIHAVDLRAGVDFGDLPDALNTALVADVVNKRAEQGHAAELARWLTGRADRAPALGPWL